MIIDPDPALLAYEGVLYGHFGNTEWYSIKQTTSPSGTIATSQARATSSKALVAIYVQAMRRAKKEGMDDRKTLKWWGSEQVNTILQITKVPLHQNLPLFTLHWLFGKEKSKFTFSLHTFVVCC